MAPNTDPSTAFGWADPRTIKARREAAQERAKAAADTAAEPRPYTRPRETCRACGGKKWRLDGTTHAVGLCPTCTGTGTVEKPL